MAKSAPPSPPPEPAILPVALADALGERYLSYALSTIMARSLPDVRDGLKPVHRRLLYAMRQLRLAADTAPKKSARVVGDVIGKYHPHGDASVYEALVRLAQDFAARYPLIDGQGNFGNIDGDNAAAMRYTEARLTAVAEALLEGIDEDTVDFRATYDNDGQEPVVLPAAFPNLLANGTQGIAVGMATSIPPHNAGELCDALLHLISKPEATVEELVRLVPGPDFPTGGVVVEPAESILEAYRTGRGGFRLRARWATEALSQGQYQIVVTEIPYQVQKSRLVERIATLVNERKVPLLADVRDESAEDVRLILEPKSRNVDAAMLMEQLFRLSELEVRIGLNMNVLDGHTVPRVMTLKEVLQAFLDHRHEVLLRHSRNRLAQIDRRLEVLAGYLIAYLNVDEVIRIIRFGEDPKAELMQRFSLTEAQAEAILNLRLRALHKLEEIEIRRENDALTAEKGELLALLDQPKRRWQAIAQQVRDIKKRFGQKTELGRRRTEIGTAPPVVEVPVEALVEREPLTVFLSEKGWIRAVRGHLAPAETAEVKYKEGDGARFVVTCHTTDKLLLFASNGRCYTLSADKVSRGRGFGEPVRLMIELGNDAEPIALLRHEPERKLLVASGDGRGFVVAEAEMAGQTRVGKQVLNLAEGTVAVACVPAQGDSVAAIASNRRLLCFPLAEVPEMARGRGVILQRLAPGVVLTDLKVFSAAAGLAWTVSDRERTETDLGAWMGRRGGAGHTPPKGFPKDNRFG